MKIDPFKLPYISAKTSAQSQNSNTSTRELANLPKRPILTHLNDDTTWLLLLPHPSPRPSRQFFRILLDPWLAGPQSDVASWFSTQWHATNSSVESISELEKLIVSVDGIGGSENIIDCVVLSHEFTDHCHKDTLLELPPDTPVFAPEKAKELIDSWHHFDNVILQPKFQSSEDGGWDWRTQSRHKLLPSWLGISRLESPGNALYYHSAVMFTFAREESEDDISRSDEAECILYTPHGITYSTLESLPSARPHIKPLALLHGLDDIQIGWFQYAQLNLGAENGLRCVRSCGGASYWVGTHDEKKVAGGLIRNMLWRKSYAIKDIVDEEAEKMGDDLRGRYVEIKNGETLVLE